MVLRPFLYSWSKIERFVPLMHSTIHKASLFEALHTRWVSPFPQPQCPCLFLTEKHDRGAESTRGERVDATRLRSWSDAPTSDASEPEISEPRLLAARITHVSYLKPWIYPWFSPSRTLPSAPESSLTAKSKTLPVFATQPDFCTYPVAIRV